MTARNNKIEITVAPTKNDDQEVIDNLTRELYIELLDTGISPPFVQLNQQRVSGAQAKGEPILSTILITLTAAGFFNALVEAIKSWSLRKESRKVRVKVQIDNNLIEYEYSPSSTTQEDLVKITNEIVKLLDNDDDKFRSDGKETK